MATSIQKIQRMGDRGYLLTILLMIIAIITAAAAFVFAGLALANADIIREALDVVVNEYNVSEAVLAVVFVLAGAMAALVAVALFFASRMFDDLRNSHTPFKAEYARMMKIVAILALVGGLITFSLATICIAALLYCFAQVFEYGVELQQAADETL